MVPHGLEIRRLRQSDRCAGFSVPDDPSLQQFIKRHAKKAEAAGASATWVAVDGDLVAAFATIVPAMVRPAEVAGLVDARSRNPLPVLLLGLMATDAQHKGRGLGRALVRVVLEQAVALRANFGCVGVLVDAKASAVGFYEGEEFVALPDADGPTPATDAPDPAAAPPAERKTRMFMTMADVRRRLEATG